MIHTENKTILEIEMQRKPHTCPCCGHSTQRVHDYHKQKIKDIPAFGSYMIILLRKRKYCCQPCGKRFYENIDFLSRYHRMTSRLALYILSQLASPSSFPRVLAVDEFKGNTNHKKYQCIITEPENHRVIDILPNQYKIHLTSYLLKFNTAQTSIFISDMWSTYRNLARDIFSSATNIIMPDKFFGPLNRFVKKYKKIFVMRDVNILSVLKRYLLNIIIALMRIKNAVLIVMLYTSEKLSNAYYLRLITKICA